jgi:hypothetical protein
MKILFGVVLTLFCFGQAFGQKCGEVDSGFRGSYFRTYYEQRHLVKTIRSLEELPPEVRARLEAYLKAKLGPAFAKRLKLDWGDWLDLEGLRQKFPELYDENLPLGAFYLVFWFSDTDKGLKAYYATVALGEDGSVNKELNLPRIGAEPEKAQIIPCKDAVRIALEQGFPESHTSASFGYSAEHDSFIWTLTDERRKDAGSMAGTYRKLDVNANTGIVLRIYDVTIVF